MYGCVEERLCYVISIARNEGKRKENGQCHQQLHFNLLGYILNALLTSLALLFNTWYCILINRFGGLFFNSFPISYVHSKI